MANAKKIVGIILLAIGLFFIISEYYIKMLMLGVILSIIGLLLLITSMKKIAIIKIVGIILLSIGAVLSIGAGFIMTIGQWTYEWLLLNATMFIGVIISVIGLILLLTSRKKNSKSPDKSIT